MVSQKPGISRYQQIILNQGSIEQTLLDFLAVDGKLKVEWNVSPEKLEWKECHPSDQLAHPVTVTVRSSDDKQSRRLSWDNDKKSIKSSFNRPTAVDNPSSGKDPQKDILEEIRAKYVLGCDGAHNWTRNQLGVPLEGQHTDHVWGVMDILPLTNFRKTPSPSSSAGYLQM